MDLSNIEIIHYVCADNQLIKVSKDTISKSKSLATLQLENKQ